MICSLFLRQAVARTIVLDPEQLAAGRALVEEYSSQATKARAEQLAAMQPGPSAAAERAAALLPELSTPHQAAVISSSMDRLTHSLALQEEAYLHLVRSLVLCILTPHQTGLLCAAAFPYLCEFPCVLLDMLSSGGGTE